MAGEHIPVGSTLGAATTPRLVRSAILPRCFCVDHQRTSSPPRILFSVLEEQVGVRERLRNSLAWRRLIVLLIQFRVNLDDFSQLGV